MKTITIPAILASGAGQSGEQSPFIVSRIARSLDIDGSHGHVDISVMRATLATLYTGQRIRELLTSNRWYKVGDGRLWRIADNKVVATFEGQCELLHSPQAITFALSVLTTRPRRNAAVAAAVLVAPEARGVGFALRYAGVDRKTLRTWRKDPFIARHILTDNVLPVVPHR